MECLHSCGSLRLKIAADDRLRAAGAEGDPFAVWQQELVAVSRNEFIHLSVADLVQALGETLEDDGLLLGVDMDIDAVGVKFANVFLKLLQDLAQRCARFPPVT